MSSGDDWTSEERRRQREELVRAWLEEAEDDATVAAAGRSELTRNIDLLADIMEQDTFRLGGCIYTVGAPSESQAAELERLRALVVARADASMLPEDARPPAPVEEMGDIIAQICTTDEGRAEFSRALDAKPVELTGVLFAFVYRAARWKARALRSEGGHDD